MDHFSHTLSSLPFLTSRDARQRPQRLGLSILTLPPSPALTAHGSPGCWKHAEDFLPQQVPWHWPLPKQPWWRGIRYNMPAPGSLLDRRNHGCGTWMFESERGTAWGRWAKSSAWGGREGPHCAESLSHLGNETYFNTGLTLLAQTKGHNPAHNYFSFPFKDIFLPTPQLP